MRSNSAMVAEPIYCLIVSSVGAQLPPSVHNFLICTLLFTVHCPSVGTLFYLHTAHHTLFSAHCTLCLSVCNFLICTVQTPVALTQCTVVLLQILQCKILQCSERSRFIVKTSVCKTAKYVSSKYSIACSTQPVLVNTSVSNTAIYVNSKYSIVCSEQLVY